VKSAVDNTDVIFWEAAQLAQRAERDAYLAIACGEDSELRQRVDQLLRVQPKVDKFLERPFAGPAATVDAGTVSEGPGTVVGPYKLLEQIGEGGMGLVFMAEQLRPVRRRVALKIIKPGMDTRQVVARFEAERQALALMDHPNIAKIFDAGTTGEGARGEERGRSGFALARKGRNLLPSPLFPRPSPLFPRPSPLLPAAPTSSWSW
jgi:eukaryotic-like serine/threonine-protein kinase